jgi:multisubunit Na+/H+ antiporter MnhB subunit
MTNQSKIRRYNRIASRFGRYAFCVFGLAIVLSGLYFWIKPEGKEFETLVWCVWGSGLVLGLIAFGYTLRQLGEAIDNNQDH